MEKLIPSFAIDHTKIVPGIFVSRRDIIGKEHITTFDIRMTTPNIEPVIHPNAMHTIEHVIATYLRNSESKDLIIYWGPMGCLTGCYLIMKGFLEPKDITDLIRKAFEYLRDYEGEVPGATPVNCGNFLLHDLRMAKYEAKRYLLRTWKYVYPKTDILKVKGKTFHDS